MAAVAVCLQEIPDSAEMAEDAGLTYVMDDIPGYQRRRVRNGFRYVDADGDPLQDPVEVQRLRSLAVPPAWTDVWYCPIPDGHLQATGRDAKGRKQYRYHQRWREVRDADKFDRMVGFGRALPSLRRRIASDLDLPGLDRDKVLAVVVRLLDDTFIRVGNLEYARDNGSYGLTTLRNRHVRVSGGQIEFRFRAKSGKEFRASLEDSRLARIVRRLQDLPGQHLFQYVADDGARCGIGSRDVNEYLRARTGASFTAKDFRTWGATVAVTAALRALDPAETVKGREGQARDALETAAARLGNTAAVCRRSYVAPAVLDAHVAAAYHLGAAAPTTPRGLDATERVTLEVLERTAPMAET